MPEQKFIEEETTAHTVYVTSFQVSTKCSEIIEFDSCCC